MKRISILILSLFFIINGLRAQNAGFICENEDWLKGYFTNLDFKTVGHQTKDILYCVDGGDVISYLTVGRQSKICFLSFTISKDIEFTEGLIKSYNQYCVTIIKGAEWIYKTKNKDWCPVYIRFYYSTNYHTNIFEYTPYYNDKLRTDKL